MDSNIGEVGARAQAHGRWRILLFPLATNSWPLLLFVSQKVFVPLGLVFVGTGDARYRRDLLLAFYVTLAGAIVYFTQPWNPYRDAHALGALLFVWAIPPLNHAVRQNAHPLLTVLSYFTLINAFLGLYFLLFGIDLEQFRGLNRIETFDGYTTRIFFESASLMAVFLPSAIRWQALRWLAMVLIAIFIVFVARSFVIMLLVGLNVVFPHLVRSPLPVKLAVVAGSVIAAFLSFLYVAELRPDIYLSLYAKQWQLEVIMSLREGISGWGWGSFIPQLSTDKEQPYQIEMQLPMLLLQLGPLALLTILFIIALMFFSVAERASSGALRLAVFLVVGFNNPWLLLPSWYLTCQLLFRYQSPVTAGRPASESKYDRRLFAAAHVDKA